MSACSGRLAKLTARLARAKSALWRRRLMYAVQRIATQHRGATRVIIACVRPMCGMKATDSDHPQRPAAFDCRALLALNAGHEEAPSGVLVV